jgi:hypothetical protein
MAKSRSEAELDRARAGARTTRSLRERRMEREEKWSRSDFFRDLSRLSAPISDPKDAARLRQSREQAKKGELHWGAEDEDSSNQSDAGE